MEKERVQVTLCHGIKMKDGDIDKYITYFDMLVQQAGY
jgi:hypothetical protein